MRFLILFLFCLPTLSSANYTTKKVFDGAVATCDTENQINRNFLGAYKAKATAIEIYKDQVIISVDLDFLACNQLGSNTFFSHKSPYEPVISPLGVRVTPEEVRLKAAVDGIYKILIDSHLDDASKQSVQLVVPISELVANTSNQATLDLWITKALVWEKDDIYSESISNYGIFRINFTLTSVDGKYHAVLHN